MRPAYQLCSQSPFMTMKCSDGLTDHCFNQDKLLVIFWHTCVSEFVSVSMSLRIVSEYSSGRFIRVDPW